MAKKIETLERFKTFSEFRKYMAERYKELEGSIWYMFLIEYGLESSELITLFETYTEVNDGIDCQFDLEALHEIMDEYISCYVLPANWSKVEG